MKNKKIKKISLLTLLFICFFSIGISGEKKVEKLKIKGISLGMTSKQVKSVFPDLKLIPIKVSIGESIDGYYYYFSRGDEYYQLTFSRDKKVERFFLKKDIKKSEVKYKEIAEDLIHEYGKPALNLSKKRNVLICWGDCYLNGGFVDELKGTSLIANTGLGVVKKRSLSINLFDKRKSRKK